MWDQKLFELFITGIPQGFAFVLLFFSLANIKIEKKLYIFSSLTYAILAFLIRPYVNFGVHSVILLLVMIIIAVKWGKASIAFSLLYGVICYLIAYVCEWVTFLILEVFKFNMELLNTNAQIRTVIGIIPLCFLFAVGLTVYFTKKSLKKGGSNEDAV